jgi:hypothetical protein
MNICHLDVRNDSLQHSGSLPDAMGLGWLTRRCALSEPHPQAHLGDALPDQIFSI